MKYVLILTLTVLGIFQASAQYVEDDDGPITIKLFHNELDRAKIRYAPPKGYDLLYKAYSAPVRTFFLSSSRHQLQARKDSVFIYFAIIDIDTSQARSNKLKKYGLYSDVNRNYVQGVGDTLAHPIFYDLRNVSKSKYNADQSGTYDVPLTYPYKAHYTHCKGVFFHKENRADLLIYFFFNSNSQAKLSKHIKRISESIRFLP